ncbi:hypothetical protein [Planctomyces sp. SH-PL14]|uniref:hypothetical protein n=1 Tax=Planctomyces sp. SH-PL14 TaxID=1632864 RepID=UPI0009467B14|nr:hypothetical protein [Planctomyces sp. SH-PL14]
MTPPRAPRGDSTPNVTPPRTPRPDNVPGATPPRNPSTDAPRGQRPLDPNLNTPRTPGRDNAPGAGGQSIETRKPIVPDAGRDTPGNRMDEAPRPGRAADRARDAAGRAADPNRPGSIPDRARDAADRATDPTRPGSVPDRARDAADRARDAAGRATDPNRPGSIPDRARDAADRARDAADRATDPNRPGAIPDRARDAADRARDTTGRARDAANQARDAARGNLDNVPPGLTRPRDPGDTANRPVRQVQIDPQRLQNDATVGAAMRDLGNVRSEAQLQQAFSRLGNVDGNARLQALPLDRVSGRFQLRARNNDFAPLAQTRFGQRLNLGRQFSLATQGDIARQLQLNNTLVTGGGWRNRFVGPIFPGYTQSAFSAWYPGPTWYPSYAWAPQWSPWVAWSFWNNVLPIYDPRPFAVRPYYYDQAPLVTVYDSYPVWQDLPVVASGTWVDVPAVPVSTGSDLQLLAVRFVDPGHPDEHLGPRYRVWLRNNADADVRDPIDVTLFASANEKLSDQVVQAGVHVPEVPANDTIAVDIRLPEEANQLVTNDQQDRVPFEFLHAVVDSRNALKEASEENNGTILARGEIYQVDPAAFSTNVTAAAPGSVISLAGEGFGPEPGEVMVVVDGKEHPAEIRGWYDLGIQLTVPDVDVNSALNAEVLVVRGDGAASNPVPLEIAPENSIGTLSEAPIPTQR